jgi:hypothetical protein
MAEYKRKEFEREDYYVRQGRLTKEKMISSRDTPLVKVSSEQDYISVLGSKDLGTLKINLELVE